MAKKSKRIARKSPIPAAQKNFSRFGLSESYVSLALGIVVVLVIGFLALFFLRDKNGLQNVSIRDILTGESDSKNEQETKNDDVYVVREGDNLWTIAENEYKSGYNWQDIAKANNLVNPNLIEKGQALSIPKNVEVIRPELAATRTITGSSYTVVEGDTLWDISVRAYGDGYRWVEVSSFNKLSNPDLITVGAKLAIPR